jgi:hypothetical protein
MDYIADAKRQERSSDIRTGILERPFTFQKIVIPLDSTSDFPGGSGTPNGVKRKISFPFRSVQVIAASSTSASIKLAPHDDSLMNEQNAIPLSITDSFDFGKVISGGFLFWNFQVGETITLIFSVDGNFKTGKTVQAVSTTASVSDGTTVTTGIITQSGAGSGVLCAADLTRVLLTCQVQSGTFYLGDAGVSAGAPQAGIMVNAGQSFQIRNQGAWTYYSPSGGVINTILEK